MKTGWKCRACGSRNPADANFCIQCGAKKSPSVSVSRKIGIALLILLAAAAVLTAAWLVSHRQSSEASGKGVVSSLFSRPTPTPTPKQTRMPEESTPRPTKTPAPADDAAQTEKPSSMFASTITPVPTSVPTAAPTPTPVPTSVPTAAPTPTPAPVQNSYQSLVDRSRAYDPNVEVPTAAEMLDQPVTRYVHGSYPNSPSGGMYLCRSPGKDGITVLKPHTPVTVHAVRGSLANSTGYAFVETNDGRYGWVAFRATRGMGLVESNDF